VISVGSIHLVFDLIDSDDADRLEGSARTGAIAPGDAGAEIGAGGEGDEGADAVGECNADLLVESDALARRRCDRR